MVNRMKRIIALILSAIIVFSLTACNDQPAPVSSVPETAAEAEAPSPSPVPSPEPSPSEEPQEDPLEYVEKLFDGHILEIEITAEERDWAYLMEHATEKPWLKADITVDGVTFPGVGVKTKGNSSLSQVAGSDSDRYGLKVSFGRYEDDQTCYGLDKLNINNIYGDATYMKEYMSFHLMNYMQVPGSLHTFARVTVNGEYFGFCFILEDTDDSFLYRIYGEGHEVEAYKPESMGMTADPNDEGAGGFPGGPPGGFPDLPEGFPDFSEGFPEGFPAPPADFPGFPGGGFPGGSGGFDQEDRSAGVALRYIDDDPESYHNIFDNNITKPGNDDEARLISAIKAIDEGQDLESCIDVDEVLRYTACNVFLVNLDSYFSNMGHNYILTENGGRLAMLPWDYNLSFGTHTVHSASDAVNYPIDTVFSGVSAENRPIIGKLLEVEEYRDRYHQYLRQIAEEYVGSGLFAETIDNLHSEIDSYVQNDTTAFTTYDQYLAGMEALKTFGALRSQSILGQLDGTVPATEEQQSGSESLVDASALDLSALGSMGMGGGGGFPGFPGQ